MVEKMKKTTYKRSVFSKDFIKVFDFSKENKKYDNNIIVISILRPMVTNVSLDVPQKLIKLLKNSVGVCVKEYPMGTPINAVKNKSIKGGIRMIKKEKSTIFSDSIPVSCVVAVRKTDRYKTATT